MTRTLKALLLAIALVAVTGCAGSLEQQRAARLSERRLGIDQLPRDTARCESLDATRRDWGAVAKGAAVLAGGSGLSTLPVPDDEREAQIGLAAGALAMATLAAVAIAVEEGAATSWARECSGP